MGVLIQILHRKAKIAASQIRGLRIHTMAAKLAVSTLLWLLVMGGVELNPGPATHEKTATDRDAQVCVDTEKILHAITELKVAQEQFAADITARLSTLEQTMQNNLDDIRASQAALQNDIDELAFLPVTS